MSSLIVSENEELVSNVITVECSDMEKRISISNMHCDSIYCTVQGKLQRYHGEVSDINLQSSYLTPNSLEGKRGNYKVGQSLITPIFAH